MHGTLLLHKRKSDKCFTHWNFHPDCKYSISEVWSLKVLLYEVYSIKHSARLCWRYYTARLGLWGRRQLIYSIPEVFSALLPSSLQVSCSLLASSTCPHSASPSVYFSAAGAGITLTGRLCGSQLLPIVICFITKAFFWGLFSRWHVGNAHHLQ